MIVTLLPQTGKYANRDCLLSNLRRWWSACYRIGQSGLADKGHSVHFITYQQPVRLNVFNANIYYHEVRVPTYPLFDYPPYEIALASTMVDVINNHDLDLLHVHYAIPHASAAYMASKIVEKAAEKYLSLPPCMEQTLPWWGGTKP